MQDDIPIGFADIVECEASLASLTHVQIPFDKYRSACRWAKHLADDVTGRPLNKIFFFVKFSDGCFSLNLAKPRLLETISSGGRDYIQVPKSEFEPVRRQGGVGR